MFKLVVVWLLSTGQFEAQPWVDTPDLAACEKRIEEIKATATNDRLLFEVGCLKADLVHNFTNFEVEFGAPPGPAAMATKQIANPATRASHPLTWADRVVGFFSQIFMK